MTKLDSVFWYIITRAMNRILSKEIREDVLSMRNVKDLI